MSVALPLSITGSLVCCSFAGSSWAQTPAPLAGEQIAFGALPRDLLRVDVNGDGKPDVAALSLGTSLVNKRGVVLRMGDGVGGFGAELLLSGNKTPSHFAMGDLNLDGALDVVVTEPDPADPAVRLFFGNGSGAFPSSGTYLTGLNSACIDLGDVNGDGRLDLVQGDTVFSTVSVLSGDGLGGLSLPVGYAVGASASSLDLGDLDADGDLDLVVTDDLSSDVVCARNTGGALVAAGSFTTDVDASSVRVFDIDADGDADAVIGAAVGDHLVVARLGGTLPVSIQQLASVPTGASGPDRFAAGDLNGDARLDLVAEHAFGTTVAVLLATSPGVFGAPTLVPVVQSPTGIVLGDYDGDARADIATLGYATSTLRITRGLGGGAFEFSAPLSSPTSGTYPFGLALGDLDGDARLDAVVASYTGSHAAVLLGDGAGSFAPSVSYPQGAVCTGVAITDLNQDGRCDVLVADEAGGPNLDRLGILLGVGGGLLQQAGFAPTGKFPYGVVAADFSGDGRIDAASADIGAGTVSLLAGDGAGGLGAPLAHALNMLPRCIATADMNLDGRPDVVVRGQGTGDLAVLLGAPAGGFVAATSYNVPDSFNQSQGLALGDLNEDGWPDVATTHSLTGSGLALLYGQGAGALGAVVTVTGPGVPVGVAIGDVDADGVPDLVANHASALLSWWRGNGSGSFLPARLFQSAPGGEEIALGDVDADGRLDAVVSAGQLLVVQRNLLGGPVGVSPYGVGTPGCQGSIALSANSAPKLGNSMFALLATNAPPKSSAIGVLAAAADFAGSSVLLPGLVLHVDPFGGPYSLFGMSSTLEGQGWRALAIPNDSQLAGQVLYAQTYWPEFAPYGCTQAALPFASSRGVALTLQP
jgi:hypothetical protein